jgi:hypothetical protein
VKGVPRFYFYDDKMEDTRKNWSKRINDEEKKWRISRIINLGK